ncbi:hypothetical protein B9Z65_5157 [Elsinoe australis]|uniref:Uncharacterized protein n=1 Tax=Elsinoe australis TaxID=40998 RepID=A0A2P7ZDB4_9PEZI|nr:hypothetical protein B9Z65_5157 [Elsinoe australis]
MTTPSSTAQDLSQWDADPRLFLFTSLTSGSSHIFTATSRLETILKANKIPFQAIDTATDEQARRLWQRRAGKRKLPALVKEGFIVGDIEEVEELNEFGELREAVGLVGGVGGGIMAGGVKSGGMGLGGGMLDPKGPKAGTVPPPNTKAPGTPQPPEKQVDPMRDLAAQAASVGLARKQGLPVKVGEEKIAAAAQGDVTEEKAAVVGARAAQGGVEGEVKGVAEDAGTEKKDEAEKEVVGATETAEKSADLVTGEVAETTSVLDDNTKPETMTSAADKKEESVEAAAVAGGDEEIKPAVPETVASSTKDEAVASTDSLASAPSRSSLASDSTATSTSKRHRGSEVMEASEEEIKEVENGNTITEQEGEDEADETLKKAAQKLDPQSVDKVDDEPLKSEDKADLEKPVQKDEEANTVAAGAAAAPKVEARESEKTTSEAVKKGGDGNAAGVSVED